MERPRPRLIFLSRTCGSGNEGNNERTKPEATGQANANQRREEKTTKGKRRNKKIRKQFTNFKMIYSNINHALSKIESLRIIMEEEKPAVVVLVETKLAELGDIEIEGYKSWPMNRDESGGGVMILMKKELKNIVRVNEEQRDMGEVMWITISNGRTNIRLGVVYAPQEGETTVPRLKEMYKRISKQIK